jgi:CRISPR-associated protein Csb1
VNLVALRGLRGANDDETNAIRKYLLGLSLVAATADIDLFLREGCLLRYADNGDAWYQVPRRGEPTAITLDSTKVMEYAKEAAEHFRSRWPKDGDLKHEFNLAAAKKLLAKKTAEEESAKAD